MKTMIMMTMMKSIMRKPMTTISHVSPRPEPLSQNHQDHHHAVSELAR